MQMIRALDYFFASTRSTVTSNLNRESQKLLVTEVALSERRVGVRSDLVGVAARLKGDLKGDRAGER